MNCDQAATTEILWTGGWDSTFRVLDLLARCDGTIQPHYLRDRDRASWKLEVETMEAIREHANRRFGSRILPPKLSDRTDIEVPEQVKAWFRLLNQQFRLGSQYIWLSQYSLNETDGRLELCVHVDDKAHKAISWAQSHRDREEATEIVEAVDGLLLSTFHFPILTCPKLGCSGRQGMPASMIFWTEPGFAISQPSTAGPVDFADPAPGRSRKAWVTAFPETAVFAPTSTNGLDATCLAGVSVRHFCARSGGRIRENWIVRSLDG